ncbi:tripartite tricarboxylate transporter substrate binding protein [Limnohabitans sp. 2KL-51]|jgi:tripartite-type tricarboxylate transporter receptor subunit TctC|uniref:Bug family tripartite tricarboxylate transporter substrate binding protein n=1 Tax=Limnohabitans sp. 2KL-51 TaxID=1977911 RepID=UPI000DD245C8|nr:tripartite tricarboxylate transporter substrate binding protein [Limnohabitans sp. 2KL-51]PUE46028.1 solute receptor [Limnohabitans sp. 2KL-51]
MPFFVSDTIASASRSRGLTLIAALLAVCASSSALAQAWPQRPIKVVIPFPPGGPTDLVMRTATEKIQTILKQPVVIENQPGAGGNIGAATVARAAPDGYTFLFATDTLLTVNPHVYKSMPFKLDDLKPISVLSSFSQTLVCNPSLGVKTVSELIAKSKTMPLSYASGGAGVPGHLSTELLLSMTGMQMTHIPYKGPAPAMQDVLANQVPCGLLAGPTVLPHVRSGKLTALAVSGHARSPSLPEVPTMDEAGVKGYEADFSLILMAPKQVPDDIVAKFRQAVVDALRAPEATERLKASDQIVIGSTPEQAVVKVAKDFAKWGAVSRKIGLSLD